MHTCVIIVIMTILGAAIVGRTSVREVEGVNPYIYIYIYVCLFVLYNRVVRDCAKRRHANL